MPSPERAWNILEVAKFQHPIATGMDKIWLTSATKARKNQNSGGASFANAALTMKHYIRARISCVAAFGNLAMKLKTVALSLGLLLSSVTMPAYADVKGGVDAWDRGDYTKAVAQWRPLAISGDADAQFNLAQAYKLGRGVPADLKIAQDWYGKAAAQGHLRAEDNLGLVMFQNGDRQKAMPVIERSAGRGDPRAQYVLGTALFNGDMIKKDWIRAYALMTRASASGLAPASASLAQMDKYIPLEQRQKGLAMARDLEVAASRPVMDETAPVRPVRSASAPVRTQALPPSQSDAPEVEAPRPVKVAVAMPKPKPVAVKPPAPAKPAAAAASGPSWRIQLGAFGDQSNARALWNGLETRVASLGNLQPYLVKAGAVTRLQAGPLASKAAAERACASVKAAGQGCLVVAP
jgi:uncharacterized protein